MTLNLILRAVFILLCALLSRIHLPDSFAKPPPLFSVVTLATPIAQDWMFCLLAERPILHIEFCAVSSQFHLLDSYAKPPPWTFLCYSGHTIVTMITLDILFLNGCCAFLQLIEEHETSSNKLENVNLAGCSVYRPVQKGMKICFEHLQCRLILAHFTQRQLVKLGARQCTRTWAGWA